MIRPRLSVEPLTSTLVCVREHRGNRIELEHFATFVGGAWIWDHVHTRVPPDVDALIRSAAPH
jgi:hypothetical protein